jgi:hypothetical protein
MQAEFKSLTDRPKRKRLRSFDAHARWSALFIGRLIESARKSVLPGGDG